MFRGEDKKTKKGNVRKGKPFVLSHCYEVLKDEEKWKRRDHLDVINFPTVDGVLIGGEDGSSDDANPKRSPTPNSVSYANPRRPTGGKATKLAKKKG